MGTQGMPGMQGLKGAKVGKPIYYLKRKQAFSLLQLATSFALQAV